MDDDELDVRDASPNALVSASVGVIAVLLNFAGIVVLPGLLAVVAIITGVIALVRDEALRSAAAVGLIAAVLVFF